MLLNETVLLSRKTITFVAIFNCCVVPLRLASNIHRKTHTHTIHCTLLLHCFHTQAIDQLLITPLPEIEHHCSKQKKKK